MEQKIKFKIYEGSETEEAEATIKDNVVTKIKLIVSVPRRFFYSMLNDAGAAFEEQYPQFIHYV